MRLKTTTPRLRSEWEPLEVRCVPTAIIALVDTGIDLTNSSLSPYYDFTYAYDAYNKQTAAAYGNGVVSDLATHGRYVADFMVQGITATKAQSGAGGADVKIMPIRVAYTSGGTTYLDGSAIVRGIYWAADHGADVINLSYKSTGETRLFDASDPHNLAYLSDAIKYAESMGAVVVTASANDSKNIDLPGNVTFPPYADDTAYAHANPAPTNLMVAAGVDSSGNLTSISNWGPIHVDFGALANGAGETSYSAGYASGVTATIADLLPSGYAPSALVNIIKQTVTPKTQSVATNWSSTNGNINPAGAVARVTASVRTIDDTSAGTGPEYTKTGTWDYFSGLQPNIGFGGDASSSWTVGTTGAVTATATWTFNNLSPGRYVVWASWYRDSVRATDSPFTVKNGSTVLQTWRVDQSNSGTAPAPDMYDENGLPWWVIGNNSFLITGNQLVVTLSNNAGPTGKVVQADAVRIARIDTVAPTIDDTSAGMGPEYTKTGTWDYFSGLQPNIGFGGDASSSWTVGTTGAVTATATWTFNNLSPGRYVVWASWYRDSVRATDSPFTVKNGSTVLQTWRVDQSNSGTAPAPDMYDENGLPWWIVGNTSYQITGNQLVVTLSNNASPTGKVVQADAVRIVRIDGGLTTLSLMAPSSSSSSGESSSSKAEAAEAPVVPAPVESPAAPAPADVPVVPAPAPGRGPWKLDGGYRRAPQAQPQLFDVRTARLARAYQALAENKRRWSWLDN